MWQTLGYIVGLKSKSSRVSFQLVRTPLEASTLAPLVRSSPVAVSSRTLCEADPDNFGIGFSWWLWKAGLAVHGWCWEVGWVSN